MKNFAITLVWLTTAYVFGFAVLTQMAVSMSLLMTLFIAGHFLILFMVYKVLTDNYSSKKTFSDWYEDQPRNPTK